MIILTQSKDCIINVDNCFYISFNDTSDDYTEYTVYIESKDRGIVDLGYYDTEERAKEIIKEIFNTFSNKEYVAKGHTIGEFLIINTITKFYEMPEN